MGHDEARQIHERLNNQDVILTEIRDTLIRHIAHEEELTPHLRDMVALWRGSKMMAVIVTALAAALGAGWSTLQWIKDHLK